MARNEAEILADLQKASHHLSIVEQDLARLRERNEQWHELKRQRDELADQIERLQIEHFNLPVSDDRDLFGPVNGRNRIGLPDVGGN